MRLQALRVCWEQLLRPKEKIVLVTRTEEDAKEFIEEMDKVFDEMDAVFRRADNILKKARRRRK